MIMSAVQSVSSPLTSSVIPPSPSMLLMSQDEIKTESGEHVDISSTVENNGAINVNGSDDTSNGQQNAAHNGGVVDELESSDEVKIFQNEGEDDDSGSGDGSGSGGGSSIVHQSDLLEEKSSLITESEKKSVAEAIACGLAAQGLYPSALGSMTSYFAAAAYAQAATRNAFLYGGSAAGQELSAALASQLLPQPPPAHLNGAPTASGAVAAQSSAFAAALAAFSRNSAYAAAAASASNAILPPSAPQVATPPTHPAFQHLAAASSQYNPYASMLNAAAISSAANVVPNPSPVDQLAACSAMARNLFGAHPGFAAAAMAAAAQAAQNRAASVSRTAPPTSAPVNEMPSRHNGPSTPRSIHDSPVPSPYSTSSVNGSSSQHKRHLSSSSSILNGSTNGVHSIKSPLSVGGYGKGVHDMSMGYDDMDMEALDPNDNINPLGRKAPPHIKKPLNAFMLYMKEMRPVVQAECTLKESAAINQILGRRWQSLSRDEQSKYYEKARSERQKHMELYPDWNARDNYRVSFKKKKKQRTRERTTPRDETVSSTKKCRARYGLNNQEEWCKPCRRKKKCIRILEAAGKSQNQQSESQPSTPLNNHAASNGMSNGLSDGAGHHHHHLFQQMQQHHHQPNPFPFPVNSASSAVATTNLMANFNHGSGSKQLGQGDNPQEPIIPEMMQGRQSSVFNSPSANTHEEIRLMNNPMAAMMGGGVVSQQQQQTQQPYHMSGGNGGGSTIDPITQQPTPRSSSSSDEEGGDDRSSVGGGADISEQEENRDFSASVVDEEEEDEMMASKRRRFDEFSSANSVQPSSPYSNGVNLSAGHSMNPYSPHPHHQGIPPPMRSNNNRTYSNMAAPGSVESTTNSTESNASSSLASSVSPIHQPIASTGSASYFNESNPSHRAFHSQSPPLSNPSASVADWFKSNYEEKLLKGNVEAIQQAAAAAAMAQAFNNHVAAAAAASRHRAETSSNNSSGSLHHMASSLFGRPTPSSSVASASSHKSSSSDPRDAKHPLSVMQLAMSSAAAAAAVAANGGRHHHQSTHATPSMNNSPVAATANVCV